MIQMKVARKNPPPEADLAFESWHRRRMVAYCVVTIVGSTLVTALLGDRVAGQSAYLVAWVVSAGFLTTPGLMVAFVAVRRSPASQRLFWWLWFAGLLAVYACGWLLLYVAARPDVSYIEWVAPTMLMSPAAIYAVALIWIIRTKSGGRDVTVDAVDFAVAFGAAAAPGLLLLIGPITDNHAGFFTISATVIALVMPAAVAATITLFSRIPKGYRGCEGLGIALTVVALINALLQVAQGLSEFTLPAAPLVFVQAVNMSLLLLVPLYSHASEVEGLERLPVQDQARRLSISLVLVLISVPVLITETVLMRDERPWAVPFSLGVLGGLVALATVREFLTARETRRLYREVHAMAEQRKVLLADLMGAVEKDRHRMAAELHQQALGALSVLATVLHASTSTLQPSDAADLDKALAGVRADVAAQVESLRRLMLAVRPPVLDDESMSTAITVFATELFSEGPRVDIDILIDPEVALDWTTETIVYRITQEALQNVRRHAHATHVEVIVAAPDDVLEVVVRDDGVGFAADHLPEESGIASMRMFAGLDRGRLEVSSRLGGGTTVRAVLGGETEVVAEAPQDRRPLHLIVGGTATTMAASDTALPVLDLRNR
jgi:signal transduction histidine kinase